MDDFLSKPVRRQELAAALERAARSLGAVQAGTAGPEPVAEFAPEPVAELAPALRPQRQPAAPAPEPESGNDAPVVDPSVLGTLATRLGDRAPAFLTGLLTTWEGESARRLEELDAAAEAGDEQAAARAAHALKGGSASMGALRLAAACAQLEQDVRAGRTVDLPAVRTRLHAEVQLAREALGRLYRQ